MANPLVRLEFMRRFRTPAAAWGIPLAMVLPGLAVIAMYGTTVAANDWVGGNMDVGAVGMEPQVQNAVGLGMFSTVASMLMLTLIVLVPAFVGGSIAGERHSQTLQPLQLTAMTPAPFDGLLFEARTKHRLKREGRITKPAVPVVPVPATAQHLWKRRGRSGDDPTRRAERKALKGDQ